MAQLPLVAWIECETTAGQTPCHEGGLIEVQAPAALLDARGPRRWRDAIDSSDPARALSPEQSARIAGLLLDDQHRAAPGTEPHYLASLTWAAGPDSY